MVERDEDWEGCLAEFGWLDQVSASELADLAPSGRCSDVRRGEVIFTPEENPDSVFLLRSGLVRIYRISRAGDELTLGYVGPQEIFGELAGLCGFPRESYASAVTPCRVCEMPQDQFRRLLDAYPAIMLDVVGLISRRLKSMEARFTGVVFRDTFARLCAILLELALDFGRPDPAGVLIDVPLTQAELANLIGSVRQTVNPLLRKLEDDGLLAHRARRMLLLDVARLQQLVSSHT